MIILGRVFGGESLLPFLAVCRRFFDVLPDPKHCQNIISLSWSCDQETLCNTAASRWWRTHSTKKQSR